MLAWLETDLNAQLHFASGFIVVTSKRLLASTDREGVWQGWLYGQGMRLVRYDHSGVGSLELLDENSLLARWRYTLGNDMAAGRLIEHFTQQLSYQLTGVPPPAPFPRFLCPKCQRVLDAPLLPGQEECAACSSEAYTTFDMDAVPFMAVRQTLQRAAACRFPADIGQHGRDAGAAVFDHAADGQCTDSLSERQADRC